MLELENERKSELTFFLKKWQKCGLNLTEDLLVTNDLGDKKAMKSVQAAKVRFICSSPRPISQLAGAPSDTMCQAVAAEFKSSKVSGDTNSAQDICIPAIYVKVVILDLIKPVKKTNPRLFTSKNAAFPWSFS